MKLSENDVFRRAVKKLIEDNSVYPVGFYARIFELIEEHEE